MDKYLFQELVSKTNHVTIADDCTDLWAKYAHDSSHRPYTDPAYVEWGRRGYATLVTDSEHLPEKKPLDLRWEFLDGYLVCFVRNSSRIDEYYIRNYVKETFQCELHDSADTLIKGIILTRVANGHANQDIIELKEAKRAIGREAAEAYEESGVLTSRLMLEVAAKSKDKVPVEEQALFNDLKQCFTDIDRSVDIFCNALAPSLQSYYSKAKDRYHRACADGIVILMGGMAGRLMITIKPAVKDSNDYVSIVGFENPSEPGSFGLHGLYCTKDIAVELLSRVVNQSKNLLKNLQPDSGVGLG